MREHYMDTIKVSTAGLLGFVSQLSNLDLFFRASIGFLTCVYLTAKIIQMIRGWNKKEKP